jgi:hypothetical protein
MVIGVYTYVYGGAVAGARIARTMCARDVQNNAGRGAQTRPQVQLQTCSSRGTSQHMDHIQEGVRDGGLRRQSF